MSQQDPANSAGPDSDDLNGWKEIAAYLGKSVRSVQRWERAYGLPVRRIQAAGGEVIFAVRREVDAWKLSNQAPGVSIKPEPSPALLHQRLADGEAPASQPRRIRGWVIAAAICVCAAVALAYSGILARRTPTVSVAAPFTGAQGHSFQLAGQGFTPGGGVTRWTTLPNGNSETLSAPLLADDHGGVRWALSTDCRTETGTHRIWMVDDRTSRAGSPVSLVVLRNPECDKPAADMVARSVNLDRASVRAGDEVAVTFSIWNLGAAPAPATTTRLRLGSQSTRTGPGDRALGDYPMPPIAVGESRLQRVEVVVPRDVAPGVYYVWVVADNGSATVERDSHNNFARSEAISIQVR
jgi:hypothetical protein